MEEASPLPLPCLCPALLLPTRTSSPPPSEATTNHFMFQVEMFCARFSGRARKWRLFAVALGQTHFRWKLFSFTVFLSEKTSLSLFVFSVGFKVPGLSCGGAACQWAGVALPGTASPSPASPTETLQLPGPRAPALLSLLLRYSSCCKKKTKTQKAFPVVPAGPWSSPDAAAQSKK